MGEERKVFFSSGGYIGLPGDIFDICFNFGKIL